MQISPTTNERPKTHTWTIPLMHDGTGLADRGALSVQVCAIQTGDRAGEIELDVLEHAGDRRISMTEREAEALAHVFARAPDGGSQRIAHALLDAAHAARLNAGKPSERTDIGKLK